MSLTDATHNFAREVTDHVRGAWALERDRVYAEIAELRDEVHEIGLRGGGTSEAVTAELAALNGRMEKLTLAVAGLMADAYPSNEGHSVKVDP